MVDNQKAEAELYIPARFFLYTLDQIAYVLSLDPQTLKTNGYIFYEGRSTYAKRRGQMSARNIAPDGKPPVWRVLDQEFFRWMRHKGFKYYESGKFREAAGR